MNDEQNVMSDFLKESINKLKNDDRGNGVDDAVEKASYIENTLRKLILLISKDTSDIMKIANYLIFCMGALRLACEEIGGVDETDLHIIKKKLLAELTHNDEKSVDMAIVELMQFLQGCLEQGEGDE